MVRYIRQKVAVMQKNACQLLTDPNEEEEEKKTRRRFTSGNFVDIRFTPSVDSMLLNETGSKTVNCLIAIFFCFSLRNNARYIICITVNMTYALRHF